MKIIAKFVCDRGVLLCPDDREDKGVGSRPFCGYEIRWCCDRMDDLYSIDAVQIENDPPRIILHIPETMFEEGFDHPIQYCPFCGRELKLEIIS